MKARVWLDSQDGSGASYRHTLTTAQRLYPNMNISMGMKGLSDHKWQDTLVNGIIDLEEQWGFDRNDWFIMSNNLFCTDDTMLAMFKMMK